MNPVFRAAADSAQLGWLMGAMTIGFLLVFVGWTAWVLHPANRQRMEQAALMPLEDEGDERP